MSPEEIDRSDVESSYDSLSELEDVLDKPYFDNSDDEKSDSDNEMGTTKEQEFDHLDFADEHLLESFDDTVRTIYFEPDDSFLQARSIMNELSKCKDDSTARHDLCLVLNWALTYGNAAAALETGLVSAVFTRFQNSDDVVTRLLLLIFLRLCLGVRECRCYYSDNITGLPEYLSSFLVQESYFGNYLRRDANMEPEMQQDILAIAYAVCTWPHFSFTRKVEVEDTPGLYQMYVQDTHARALATLKKGGGLPFFPRSDPLNDIDTSECLQSRLTGITGQFCPSTIAMSTMHMLSDAGTAFLKDIKDKREVVESVRVYHSSQPFNWEAIRLSQRLVSRRWFLKSTADKFVQSLWKPINVFLMGGTFDRCVEAALICLNDCIAKFHRIYDGSTNFTLTFFSAPSRKSSIVDWITDLGDYEHPGFSLVWGLALSLTPIIFDHQTIEKLCNRLRCSIFTEEKYNHAVGYTAAAVAYLVVSERIQASESLVFKLIQWVHSFDGLPSYKRTQLVRRLYQALPEVH